MKPLWAAWPKIRSRIARRKTKLFLLDFDGTLAPIAKVPHAVLLSEETKQALMRLAEDTSYRIAIVTGRSLKDIQSFFHLKNIFYIGNHGLEMKGRGLSAPRAAKKAKKLRALIWLLAEKLKTAFRKVPGVWVEDKNYTLSVHYRNMPKEYRALFRRRMGLFMRKHKHYPIVWRRGKKAWEARPRVRWDKGDAALYLSRKFPQALPVVVGDDATDEDMFRALKRRGITIRVGRSKRSLADYYLASPRDVGVFLGKLCR